MQYIECNIFNSDFDDKKELYGFKWSINLIPVWPYFMSTSQINLETDSNHMAVIKIGFYFHGYAISINLGKPGLKVSTWNGSERECKVDNQPNLQSWTRWNKILKVCKNDNRQG